MDTNQEIIGKRLRSARMLTGMSRKDFGEKTGISPATLRIWENPQLERNGITKKGALRFIHSLKKLDIDCSLEWLLEGIGGGPKFTNTKNDSLLLNIPPSSNIDWGEDELICKEIQFFKDINHNAIVVEVLDDSMSPFYEIGDYVGGCWKIENNFHDCINKNCIVLLNADQIVIKKIVCESSTHHYTLSSINPKTTASEPILYNKKILKAAPIIWHRSKK